MLPRKQARDPKNATLGRLREQARLGAANHDLTAIVEEDQLISQAAPPILQEVVPKPRTPSKHFDFRRNH